MSRIIYAYQAQLVINNTLYLITKNIALHGSNKILLPEGSLNDEAISNAGEDVIFFNASTGGKPDQIRSASVTSDVWKAIDIQRTYINNIYGMNEFSQGQIPRELSSFAIQSAMEMDDKYRIRLFNKKKLYLQEVYYQGLENTIQFMTEQRRLSVAGLENFTDDGYFSSAKLIGDYDYEVIYGPYLPVDPAARKQQLLEFVKSGFYEKAGGNLQKMAKLLIDGSLLDVKQTFEQSSRRQLAEIDSLIDGTKVTLQPWDDDEQHAAAIEDYAHTATFEALPTDIKAAIWSHGEEHVKRIAEKIAKGQQKPAAQPGGKPGEMPPPPVPELNPQTAPNSSPLSQPSGSII
jgi:hypothetical protein